MTAARACRSAGVTAASPQEQRPAGQARANRWRARATPWLLHLRRSSTLVLPPAEPRPGDRFAPRAITRAGRVAGADFRFARPKRERRDRGRWLSPPFQGESQLGVHDGFWFLAALFAVGSQAHASAPGFAEIIRAVRGCTETG